MLVLLRVRKVMMERRELGGTMQPRLERAMLTDKVRSCAREHMVRAKVSYALW